MSEAPSSLACQSLSRELECPICLHILDNPVILPCFHSLCSKCAQDLVRERMLQCPSCRRTHFCASHNFPTNFQLKSVIAKLSRQRSPGQAPSMKSSVDEMFCTRCFTCRSHPVHADCRMVSQQEGNCLVKQREDEAVFRSKSKYSLGDQAIENNNANENIWQTTVRRLQGEVNKAANEVIESVNQQRLKLNKEIEDNYSTAIENLRRQSAEIREKLKAFKDFTPDFSENLITRIKKLKEVEVALDEFRLPNLEPLKADLLEFKRNILTEETFSFGQLLNVQPIFRKQVSQPTIEKLPVLHSQVCLASFLCFSDARQFFLHPLSPKFPVLEEFRHMAARDLCLSQFQNPEAVRVEWRNGNSSGGNFSEREETLNECDRQVWLHFGGSLRAGLGDIEGDYLYCEVRSSDKLDRELAESRDGRSELKRLVTKFNNLVHD